MRCETPFLSPTSPFLPPDEDEKSNKQIPNTGFLTHRLPRELDPPPLHKITPQGPLVGKFARCHSPQGPGKPLILPLTGACRAQAASPKLINVPRRLSPQAGHGRVLLGVQMKKPVDISVGDTDPTSSNAKLTDLNNRSPREFKITTKRALDLQKPRPASPGADNKRFSIEEFFEAVSAGDLEKIAAILESKFDFSSCFS